jgi:hypothetical protein
MELAMSARVEVYWNLHKDTYSVRALSGPERGRVVDHSRVVNLKDVKFAVQPAGRKKVLKEKVKNVHAFVRGKRFKWNEVDPEVTFKTFEELLKDKDWVEVTYNPYKFESFVTRDHLKPVYEAKEVRMFVHCGRAKMFVNLKE